MVYELLSSSSCFIIYQSWGKSPLELVMIWKSILLLHDPISSIFSQYKVSFYQLVETTCLVYIYSLKSGFKNRHCFGFSIFSLVPSLAFDRRKFYKSVYFPWVIFRAKFWDFLWIDFESFATVELMHITTACLALTIYSSWKWSKMMFDIEILLRNELVGFINFDCSCSLTRSNGLFSSLTS